MSGELPIASGVTTVVVIGASGFIGEYLLKDLAARQDIEIRVLVHRTRAKSQANISFIEGDLLKPESLNALLSKNCTVINLAYLAQNNLQAMTNLASACANSQVRRLIHCSTAVVVGAGGGNSVTEKTPCLPTTEYQSIKLQIEATLLEMAAGKFEVSILRPTAVFGPGGQNLLKLANQLMSGNMWVNYIRSCLFNRRSLNLVCVENVVAALVFLLDAANVDREIFIISDDDVSMNNYRDVEASLLAAFGKSYRVPRVFIPGFVLGTILRSAGRLSTNPSVKFSGEKIVALGLNKPKKLEVAINEFAGWYKKTCTIIPEQACQRDM